MEEKLTIFMRYLATGDSYKSLAYSYRMNDRTVSSIVRDVSEAIWVKMQLLFMPEPTEEFWKNEEQDFKAKWNFSNCIGSIDGKHVTIVKPAGNGSCYFDYKGHFSIVVLAAVDAHYRFTLIDVGSMGRFSDRVGLVTVHIPPPKDLVSFDELLYNPVLGNTPHVFVGDEAFPLMQNLMLPYPKRSIHDRHDVKVFNYRLSRARQTVECAFGILATRFRAFRKPFEIKVDTVDKVVKAACVLHNYLRSETIRIGVEHDLEIEEIPAEQLISLQPSRIRAAIQNFIIRDNFTEFFNSFGKVAWQVDCVKRGKYC